MNGSVQGGSMPWLRRLLLRAIELLAVAGVLLLVLAVLDVPSLDSFSDAQVKQRRYANSENVFRAEGYSRYHVNSYGLIGKEPLPLDTPHVYRIAVFGDSYVQALQVDATQNFTGLLEQRLSPPPGFAAVETWNFGFAGDNTGNSYARWLYMAHGVPFNAVVFAFNDGDPEENRPGDVAAPSGAYLVPAAPGGYRLVYPEHAVAASWTERWLRPYFGQLVFSQFTIRNRLHDYIARLPHWDSKAQALAATPHRDAIDQAELAAQITETANQLAFVVHKIAATGATVVLLAIPSHYAVAPELYPDLGIKRQRIYRALTARLRSAGLPLVDPYSDLQAALTHGEDPYGAWEPGGHLNRQGHALIAAALAQALVSRSARTGMAVMGH